MPIPSRTTPHDDRADTLTGLADEHAVTELLGALAAAREARDAEAERSCWAHDAVPTLSGDAGDAAITFEMQFRSDVDVRVAGDRATAESLVIAPTTVDDDAATVASWRTWRQFAELVHTDDGWRIAELVVEPIISARYEDGWGAPGA